MKRILSLLALLCLVCTGAWADISLDLTKKYYIQAVNGGAYVKLNDSGNATLSAAPETQFEIAETTDGGFTIHAENGYLIGSGWDAKCSSEAKAWTIEETTQGYLISQTHANHTGKLGFDSNAVGSPLYCNKGNFYFLFVDASVQRAKVTYVYSIGNREWCREELMEPVGSTVSAPPAKAFATLSYDSSLTVAADGTTTVGVTCTPDLPFSAADTFSGITQWYALSIHSNANNKMWIYNNEGALGFVHEGHEDTAAWAWGFVGNLIDGFKIVNKLAGANYCISDDNPCQLSAGENYVTLYPSRVNPNDGFCVKTNGDYYNYQSGAIKRWGDNDNGSTFQLAAITVEEQGYTVSITGLPDNMVEMGGITVEEQNYGQGDVITGALGVNDVEVTPIPGYHGAVSIEGETLVVTYTALQPQNLNVTLTPARGTTVTSLSTIRLDFGENIPMFADEYGLTAEPPVLTNGSQQAELVSFLGDLDEEMNLVYVATFEEVTAEGNWTFSVPSGNFYFINDDDDIVPVAAITANYVIGTPVEPVNIDVTYNIYTDGELIRSTTVQNETVGEAPTYTLPAMPEYVSVMEGLPETLGATDTEVNIITTYSSAVPFETGKDYSIVLNGQTTSWNGSAFPLGNAAGRKIAFTVGGNWLDGFTFFNKEADKYLSFGSSASPKDKTNAGATTNPDEAGARLDLVINSGKNYLKIHGTTNNSYANNRDSYFSTWSSTGNIGNGGSQITFTALATYTLSITGAPSGNTPSITIGGDTFHSGDEVVAPANLSKNSITAASIANYTAIIEISGTQIAVRYVQGQQTSGNPAGVTVQADKVYRIYSVRHTGWMMTERMNNTVGTINVKGTNDYAQMWVVTANSDNATYSLRNVNTGHYIQFPNQNATAQTTTSAVKTYFINKDATNHYYGISENASGDGNKNLNTNTAMDNVVGWSMGTDPGSQWVFEEVPASEITLEAVKTRLKGLNPFGELESGKYYRLQNYAYPTRYMAEAYTADGKVWGYEAAKVANQNSLIWKIEGNATNGYTLQNVLTGHYIADQGSTSAQFPTTATAGSAKKFMVHAEGGDDWNYPHYAFHRATNDQASLHCASTQSYWVVKWTYNGANASFWYLEPVELSADDLAAIAQEYQDYLQEKQDLDDVNTNAATLNGKLQKYFSDYACTQLRDTYANATDESLTSAMTADGIPAALREMAVRVKNDTWNSDVQRNRYDKLFRISTYECYSKNTVWSNITGTGAFAELINPTGITVKNGDVVYIYVNSDVHDSDATIGLQLTSDTNVRAASRIDLHKGVNAWMSSGDGELFIDYTLNNSAKYLSNYPAIKVHIEGGRATGCWDMHRGMTNADWAWLTKHAFEDTFLHVKGHSTVLNLLADNVRSATDPVRIMKGWDFAFEHLQRLIGHDGQWDGRYRPVINPRHSYSGAPNWGGYGGSNHPSVTSGYLFNYDNFYNGNIWEILHEEGHGHSGPINCAGMTEISNNSLSQMVSYEWGLNYSRGEGGKGLMEMFNYTLDGTKRGWTWVDFMRYADPYYDYSLHVANQMLYHLYLYFEVLGHHPGFMPRVYDWLRANGGIQKGSSIANPTIYKNDYLKLAQACAEVTQTDLSEFFEAHGMFKYYEDVLSHRDQDDDPTAQANHILYIGDYGGYFMKMPSKNVPEDVAYMNEFIQNMKNMPNKAPNILFMEDRIETQTVSPDSPVAQLDPTVAGKEKVRYWEIDKMGDMGQFTDFTGKNTANGLDYTISTADATLTLKDLSKQDFTQTGKTVTVTGDGLVGIKIYDADGNLVYLANTRDFFVPTNIATGLQNGTYTLVAALADQTNLPLAKPGVATCAVELYNGTDDDHQTYQASDTQINANIPYTANNGKDFPTLTENAILRIDAANNNSLPQAFRSRVNTIYKVDGEWEAPHIVLTDKKDYYAPEDYVAHEAHYERTNTAGLNSVCMPFSITADLLPTGSKIYVLSNVGETALTFTETDYTAPGEFCLVDCPDNTKWEINVPADSYLTGVPADDANSVGSFQNGTVGAGHYKLNGDGTKFGITTDAGKVTAFRGYIDAPAAASAKSLAFSLEKAPEKTPSIPLKGGSAEERAYDLNGHQLSSSKGGLILQRGQTYIINGQKMIVR